MAKIQVNFEDVVIGEQVTDAELAAQEKYFRTQADAYEKEQQELAIAQAEAENTCCVCGRRLARALPGWKEDGVCSARCWADLFGEWDAE